MFQLDRGDLDFGLYRIMNLKAAEIGAFLDDDLLPQVTATLRRIDDHERVALEAELETVRKRTRDSSRGSDTNPSSEIAALTDRLAEMKKDAAAEADVYNHLANFFARYYTEGDFISQRRYSSGSRSAHLIPYDGEEVKLHWANADQYYVKTTENYAAYAFTAGTGDEARRVRFEIAAADNEKDNVKETNGRQRRFTLTRGKAAVAVEDGELVVRFEHRPLTEREKKQFPGTGATQQVRLNEAAAERILHAMAPDWRVLLTAPAPTNASPERTLLAKHVDRYTAKNSFDYFIHKDLGGFLRRELDLYLNTKVLNLDDLEQGGRGPAGPGVGARADDPRYRREDHRLSGTARRLSETVVAQEEIRARNVVVRHLGPRAGGDLPRDRRQCGAVCRMGRVVRGGRDHRQPDERQRRLEQSAARGLPQGEPVLGAGHPALRPRLHRPSADGTLRRRSARRADGRAAGARGKFSGVESVAGAV